MKTRDISCAPLRVAKAQILFRCQQSCKWWFINHLQVWADKRILICGVQGSTPHAFIKSLYGMDILGFVSR